MKQNKEKFACITAYDATFAREINHSGIEVILIGDSLGNVIQGQKTTVPVTVEDMCYHTSNVSRSNTRCLLMADLPFMSYATPEQTFENAAQLMRAGAHLIKLEGGAWLAPTIEQLSARGIAVCAHLGLTPQSVHALGGFKVQGRTAEAADRLVADAKALQTAGAQLLVLECVPSALAADVSQLLEIPVIGIGAGSGTDAQILVMHDMLGMSGGYLPKFVENFLTAENGSSIQGAFKAYHQAVKSGVFPRLEHGY